jgi:hypothetical protein
MAGTLSIISWRDIPAQVTARDGGRSAKAVLHPRFQVAIDRAAMKAGKKEFDDYVGEWRKENRPCGDDLDAEVAAEVARLEAAFPKEVLAEMAARGGYAAGGPTTAGASPISPAP